MTQSLLICSATYRFIGIKKNKNSAMQKNIQQAPPISTEIIIKEQFKKLITPSTSIEH